MMFKNTFFAFGLLLIVCLIGCENTRKLDLAANTSQLNLVADNDNSVKANSLVAQTIEAHGGIRYETAHYSFKFRDKKYTFKNNSQGYFYSATEIKNGVKIVDSLKNGKLSRYLDGQLTELSSKDISKYTNALNSVIYFVTLPHKLQDQAVNKNYEGTAEIEGQQYDILAISFNKNGGGVDFDDAFMYWINTRSCTIDYLAYSYATNDGGVRFRSAYNPRTVGGIRFQDYINYESPLGTALNKLPEKYEAGTLKELSRIKTEEIKQL